MNTTPTSRHTRRNIKIRIASLHSPFDGKFLFSENSDQTEKLDGQLRSERPQTIARLRPILSLLRVIPSQPVETTIAKPYQKWRKCIPPRTTVTEGFRIAKSLAPRKLATKASVP